MHAVNLSAFAAVARAGVASYTWLYVQPGQIEALRLTAGPGEALGHGPGQGIGVGTLAGAA